MEIVRYLAWPVAIVIVVCLVLAIIGPQLRRALDDKHEESETTKLEQALANRERALRLDQLEIDQKIARETVASRAELVNSEQTLQAAENLRIAEIAGQLKGDHLEAERQILAARTAERLEAVRSGEETDELDNDWMSQLTLGYESYLERAQYPSVMTFDEWAGDLHSLARHAPTATVLYELILMYRSFCEVAPSGMPLREWLNVAQPTGQVKLMKPLGKS